MTSAKKNCISTWRLVILFFNRLSFLNISGFILILISAGNTILWQYAQQDGRVQSGNVMVTVLDLWLKHYEFDFQLVCSSCLPSSILWYLKSLEMKVMPHDTLNHCPWSAASTGVWLRNLCHIMGHDDFTFNQSINQFLKWPNWHNHCKDHWLGDVTVSKLSVSYTHLTLPTNREV